MKRSDIFKEIEKISDPKKDFAKILSNFHYTHFFLMDRYKKILLEYDLTSPQSNVLGIIDHFHPSIVSLEEIKEMVLEPSADVSRIVKRLVEKGYVIKVANELNRRKVSIILTTQGQKIAKRIKTDKKFQRITEKISMTEAKVFVAVLAKLRLG